MKDTIHTIGILTSGGDAPGMNAAIRAVTRTALVKDFVSGESEEDIMACCRKRLLI